MRRISAGLVVSAILSLAVTVPALAGQPRTTMWVCDVPGVGRVVFVTAAEAARHGIDTANTQAGQTFADQFGESCSVE